VSVDTQTDPTPPRRDDLRRLLITSVDAAGSARSRLVPRERIASAFTHGLHASLSSVAMFTPRDEPVDAVGLDAVMGDILLRPDSSRLATLDDRGFAWAPADLRNADDSAPFFACGREAVRRVQHTLAGSGLHALVGFEVEFSLIRADGAEPRPAHDGPAYGQRPVLRNESFLADVLDDLETAGVPVLQLHAEHGHGQFEIALAARPPLDACDDDLLARLVIERTGIRHGLDVDFAPMPRVGAASNGMHVHLSLWRDGANLLAPAAADAPTAVGGSIVAGVLDALPASTALLAGSEASYERLRPGRWSGASLCWGAGNREAAVRYIPATAAGGTGGANIEVKPGDATANPYFAVAALLAAAADGVARRAVPPPPIEVGPTRLTAAEREARGIRSLPSTLAAALEELAASDLLRDALGDRLVDLYVAVRTPRA
jgi:glutamine synthetase